VKRVKTIYRLDDTWEHSEKTWTQIEGWDQVYDMQKQIWNEVRAEVSRNIEWTVWKARLRTEVAAWEVCRETH